MTEKKKKGDRMEVEMKIRGLMMDPVTNMPIVVLKDLNGNTILPIWVGIYEANAIALEIEKVSTPRPMTHDLIKTLLLGLGTGIRKVVVSELKDDTFYAVIWLDRDGELISVDSRPSDALVVPQPDQRADHNRQSRRHRKVDTHTDGERWQPQPLARGKQLIHERDRRIRYSGRHELYFQLVFTAL